MYYSPMLGYLQCICFTSEAYVFLIHIFKSVLNFLLVLVQNKGYSKMDIWAWWDSKQVDPLMYTITGNLPVWAHLCCLLQHRWWWIYSYFEVQCDIETSKVQNQFAAPHSITLGRDTILNVKGVFLVGFRTFLYRNKCINI